MVNSILIQEVVICLSYDDGFPLPQMAAEKHGKQLLAGRVGLGFLNINVASLHFITSPAVFC